MSEFVMGARLELTDNFTPILTAATRATNDFMQSVNGVSPVVSSMAAATSDFTDTLNQVGDAMEETQSQANGATSDIEAMRNAMQQFNAGLQTLQCLPRVLRQVAATKMGALRQSFIDTRVQVGELIGGIKAFVNTKITTAISGFNEFKSTVTEGKQGLVGVATAFKNIGKISISKTYNSMKNLTGKIKEFASTSVSRVVGGINDFRNGTTRGTNGANGLLTALKKVAAVGFSAVHTGISKIGSLAVTAGSKVGSGLGKLTTGVLKGFGIATAAVGAGAVAASVGIFKLANMASDLDETLNKVDVAFGENSTAVKAWSENSLRAMGLSKQTALDMSALFGDMGTSMGIPQKEAAKMSMEMTQLGADLASFKNIGIEEATTALNGVFTGETESLKRLGIVMTQTELDTFAMANGFGKTTKQMTEAEKVSLRYAFVMSRTANAQGDFARTGGGFANQLRVFQQTIKEIGTGIGAIFVPALTNGLQELNSFGMELNDIFKDGWQEGDDQKMADVFGRMIDKGVSALSSGLPKVINTVVPIINTLAGSILKALPTVLPALVNGVTTIFQSLIGLIQQNKQPLIDLAVNVVTSLVDFLITAIPDIVSIGADLIVGFAQGLAKQLPTVIPQIADSAVKAVTSFLSCAIDLLPGVLLAGMDLIVKFAQGLAKQLPIIVPQAVKAIETLVTGLMANLDALIVAGLDIINGLILGIIQNLSLILSAAMKLIQSVVTGLLNNIQLIINCALNLINALVMGLIQNIPMLLQGALQLIMGIVNGLVSNIQLIIDGALTLVNALVLGIVQNLPTIIQAAVQVVIALAIGLIQAIPQLIAAVPQLVMGIIDTILSTNWLEVGWEIVKGIGKGLWDGIKSIFGGGGEEGGEALAQGTIQGLGNQMSSMTTASQAMADTVNTGLQPDFAAIGGYGATATAGLATGLTEGTTGLAATATQIGTDATASIATGLNTGTTAVNASAMHLGTETVTGLSTGITDGIGVATNAATSTTTAVTDTFKGIDLYSCGTNAMQGFMDGLSAMKSSVMAVADGIAQSVKTTINTALDIHSPSKVMEETGKFTGEGLVVGINKTLDNVRTASQNLSNCTASALPSGGNGVNNVSPSGSPSGKSITINNHFSFDTEVTLKDVGEKDPHTLADQLLTAMYGKLREADNVLSQGEMAFLL